MNTADAASYKGVESAMKTLQFTATEMATIDKVLAAILHLGNITFTWDASKESVQIVESTAKQSVQTVARLLDVNLDQLMQTLCGRTISANREVMRKEHTTAQAEAGRDAFAKAIYGRLFTHIVEIVNRALNVNKHGDGGQRNNKCAVIGVLDIYGFEVLENNSFEQFCINYCNERLQQLFISLVLKQEQDEYAREGIQWTHIDYFDNKPICDMVDNAKNGILVTLDDSCLAMGNINDALLLENMDNRFGKDKFYTSRRAAKTDKTLEYNRHFRIQHYAGPVTYDINGFIEKNRDTLFQDFKRLLYASKNQVIASMWPEGAQSIKEVSKRPVTAGFLFKSSMNELVDKLNQKVPFYIRCIKPNLEKVSTMTLSSLWYMILLPSHSHRPSLTSKW